MKMKRKLEKLKKKKARQAKREEGSHLSSVGPLAGDAPPQRWPGSAMALQLPRDGSCSGSLNLHTGSSIDECGTSFAAGCVMNEMTHCVGIGHISLLNFVTVICLVTIYVLRLFETWAF